MEYSIKALIYFEQATQFAINCMCQEPEVYTTFDIIFFRLL